MKIKAFVTFLYALVVLAGGITGYTKAGSLSSLVMGIGFSLLLFFSAAGQYKRNTQAYYSGLILTIILTLFFAWRFTQTFAFMPSGLMVIISLLVLVPLFAIPNNSKGQ